MGDGADAARARGLAAQRRAPGQRPLDGRRPTSMRSSRPGAVGFKIHEDYGADPELIDHDAARSPTRTTSRSRSTPTGSTSPRSSRTRSRRSPAGPSTPITSRGPAAVTCPDLLGWSASRTSSARRRRRPIPCGRQRRRPSTSPMIVLNHGASYRRRRPTSPWSGSGSTRRRWRPRARSTSSARSRSSTPTRRGWAGSWRRSGGRSSSPT